MSCGDWIQGPFGLDAAKGRTFRCERTVLVVVHSVTAGTRLADIVPLLESDRRVQVTYTGASSVFSAGVSEFLGKLGGVFIPWKQATQTRFDLAIAASQGGLEQLHAPVLLVPHGVGFSKYPSVWHGPGPAARRELRETDCGRLAYHGRVSAAGIVVATSAQLERLRRGCPQAAAVAVVAGDPCLDRLAASLPQRSAYRQALGTGRRALVAVSSTWGPGSLLEQCPDLLTQLAGELPPEKYQLAAVTHPNVWCWHGRRQVSAWFADCARRGLIIVPPEEGWRAVLAAADVLVGDHGSVTCYGAAAGIPVSMAVYPPDEVDPRSQVASLARMAPRLRPDQPIAPQLEQVVTAWTPQLHAAIHAQVTSAPGQAARTIRGLMYQLMKLAEPATPPKVEPVPAPTPTAWLAGGAP
ncbi:MAG TPA: hypothetical protein VMV92_07095 [Streptosporangiaceae bacterium]|nr:hypothetical protein [Streptosporangiaceae bacterium]